MIQVLGCGFRVDSKLCLEPNYLLHAGHIPDRATNKKRRRRINAKAGVESPTTDWLGDRRGLAPTRYDGWEEKWGSDSGVAPTRPYPAWYELK